MMCYFMENLYLGGHPRGNGKRIRLNMDNDLCSS